MDEVGRSGRVGQGESGRAAQGVVRLGELLSAQGSLRRPMSRSSDRPLASADEIEAVVDALLEKSSKVPATRKLLGLRNGISRDAARIRLKAVAVLGWQHLRSSVSTLNIGELAVTCANPRLLPNEGLLRARHELGNMTAEDALIGSVDETGVFDKVRLPVRGLEFLAGGRSSMGLLTANKLANILVPKGLDEFEQPAKEVPIPSAANLRAKISEKVLGLDRQVSSLSSLLVMHLARGKLSGREVSTLCIQQEFLVSMQGAEFQISGKRSMERPVSFDSRGTFFAFAGAFAGLHEIIRKRNGRECIGFASPDGWRE